MFGLFGKSDSVSVDDFAKELAEELAKRYPPSMEAELDKKISSKRLTKILEDLYGKVSEYKVNNKLGIYKKAKLGNSFKWELKELGYSSDFVDLATEGLVVYVTRK